MEQSKVNKIFQQALQFHQKGELRQAEKLYRQILKNAPAFTSVYGNLAELLFRQDDRHGALNLLAEGEIKFPKDLAIVTALCALNAQLGKIKEAIHYGKEAVQLHPTYADGYMSLGNLYMQTGQVAEAISAFQKCTSLNPKATYAHLK